MSPRTCSEPARHVRESLSWMTQQLETIFGELGIVQYLNAFIDQGFDSWETILDITESDLDALGVKLGHRRKLQRRIANSRGVAADISLVPTAQSGPEESRAPEAQRSEAPRLDVRETNTVVITKRKYRRHPKPDENAPERPPSAYVLFSNRMREELKGRNLTFTEIAKLVGENWQSLSQSEKEPFESQAQAIKDRYHSDLAEYKKTAEYKKYMVYLQEFKAKHTIPSQDKDVSKRVKLESGGPNRSSAHATPSRTSRSGSGSEGRQPSEPPLSQLQQRLDSTDSANEPPYSPSATPASIASPSDSIHSPVTANMDMHPSERSPTFSTSPRDLPSLPPRRNSNWMDDQQPMLQRHLPSLSDVFDTQRLKSSGHPPNEVNGYGFPRDHISQSPAPTPSLAGSDIRPPMLRKDQSSTESSSSGSSYGYPRTPIEGSLPIHALLSPTPNHPFESGQQQSYFQSALEHKQSFVQQAPNGVGLPAANGYHNATSVSLHSPAPVIPHHLNHGYGAQPPTASLPRPGKQNSKLDGMSALLKAGEIVDRRAQ